MPIPWSLFTLGTGVAAASSSATSSSRASTSHGAGSPLQNRNDQPRQCGCGRWGCLEAYCRCHRRRQTRPGSHRPARRPLSLAAANTRSAAFTACDVFDTPSKATLAEKPVEDTAYYLAIGAMNMMHTIDPDVIVFAGGMIAAGDAFLSSIRKHIKQPAFPSSPKD